MADIPRKVRVGQSSPRMLVIDISRHQREKRQTKIKSVEIYHLGIASEAMELLPTDSRSIISQMMLFAMGTSCL
jgi:hypothetical protein